MINYPHINFRSEFPGKESPYILGYKLPVRRLWHWYAKGISIETLIQRYPHMKPARIIEAIAFAYDNLELVEHDIARANAPEISEKQRLLPF